MPLVQLNLTSLSDLDDGRVAEAFVHELKRVVADCLDRPGDKNTRKVLLELKVTPIIRDDGECDECEGEFAIKSSVPTRKSKTYSFGVRKGGQLVFSSTSPEAVDQTTIDDIDPSTGRVRR